LDFRDVTLYLWVIPDILKENLPFSSRVPRCIHLLVSAEFLVTKVSCPFEMSGAAYPLAHHQIELN